MEIITVKINGKEYSTHLDEHGVQRFVGNRIISKMVMENIHLSDNARHSTFASKVYTLNEVAMEYYQGKFSFDEILELYTSMQYSVSGFCDLSYFEDVEIENPLWEN